MEDRSRWAITDHLDIVSVICLSVLRFLSLPLRGCALSHRNDCSLCFSSSFVCWLPYKFGLWGPWRKTIDWKGERLGHGLPLSSYSVTSLEAAVSPLWLQFTHWLLISSVTQVTYSLYWQPPTFLPIICNILNFPKWPSLTKRSSTMEGPLRLRG
jgi:hypothetical protein